ncbi:MAG: hypothetical protein AAFP76_03855 [Bacteroidota bacterium]
MKPAHIKERRLKEVRLILKRKREIWAEQRALGYKKLEKPIRHGWFKELVITHQIERYKHKDHILEVYEKLEKRFWGRTKEEAAHKWHHCTSRYLLHKDIPTISRRQFNKLSSGAQQLCIPFQYYTKRKKMKIRFYINIPKGAYKIKFSRAYVTHTRRIDPALESENALLNQYKYKRGYYEIYKKGDKYYWDWKFWEAMEKERRERNIKRTLRGLKNYSIETILNEEISWERN